MKKLLGILVLSLLLSSNAYAKRYYVTYSNYFGQASGTSYGTKSFKNSKDEALLKCKNLSEERNINPEGCLLHNFQIYGVLDTLFNTEIEKIVWDEEVCKFEKTLKPEDIIEGIKCKSKPEKKNPKQNPDDNKVVAASSGSGFFVTGAGHLVTNYHVIEKCDAVKVSFKGKEIQADTIAIDKLNDLAIIKSEIKPSKVFPVSNEDAALLQDVIVAGFPLGKKVSSAIKIHKGTVTALSGIGDNYSNFQTDATINKGNSGGPIINQKGNVIGVAVQLLPPEEAQNIFFGVKSSMLKTFAKANGVNFLTPNYRDMSNEDLGKLITKATVYLECWMAVAKIKQMIAQEENRKAFFSEHK